MVGLHRCAVGGVSVGNHHISRSDDFDIAAIHGDNVVALDALGSVGGNIDGDIAAIELDITGAAVDAVAIGGDVDRAARDENIFIGVDAVGSHILEVYHTALHLHIVVAADSMLLEPGNIERARAGENELSLAE